MAKAVKAREYVIEVPNKVGSLAALLRVLAQARVNLLALSGEGKGRKGRIRLVGSDAAKTGRALAKAGVKAEKNDVLLVELPNRPGTGARMAEGLAEAGVNIRAGYGASAGAKSLIVLNVDKLPAASRVIKSL